MAGMKDKPTIESPPVRLAENRTGGLAPVDEFGWGSPTAPPARGNLPSPRSVLRRFGLMSAALAVLIAAVALPIIWILVKPEYRATVIVRVSPVIQRLTENDKTIPFYQNFVNTQVGLIRASDVIMDVIDDPEVQKTAWYAQAPWVGAGATRSERLLNAVSVDARSNSELIDVHVIAEAPADAVLIANTLANKYITRNEMLTKQSDDSVFRELEIESKRLTAAITLNEQELARIRRTVGHSSPVELLNQRTARLEEMVAKGHELNREVAAVEQIVSQLPAEQEAASQPAVRPDYANDPAWVMLEREWKIALHTRDAEKERLGEAHPSVARLTREAEFRESLLRDREAQLDRLPLLTAPRSQPLASLGGFPAFESQSPRERLAMLRRAVEVQTRDIEDAREAIRQLGELVDEASRNEHELRGNRENYDKVAAAITEREQARRVPGSIKIASNAIMPTKPYRDRRVILTGLAICAAISAGLGVGYLRAILDARVEDAGAARSSSGPFLGQLPNVRNPRAPDLLSGQVQRECIRIVRTAVLERLGGNRGSTILVTSAGPRAGKTTLSSLLAQSLAECGRSVLLIDADQRRSSMPDFFGVPCGPGLDRVICGEVRDDEAIFAGACPGLWIMPAGELDREHHVERLANGEFGKCLQRWRTRFDLIVIDSPPLLPVADARILAPQADGTIMVMRADHCRRDDVVEALTALSVAGGRLLGTVLTGARPPRAYLAEYGHYYGTTAG